MKLNSDLTVEKAQGFEIYHFAREGMKGYPLQEKYRDMGFLNVYKYYDHDDVNEYAMQREMGKKGARFWVFGHFGFEVIKTEDGKRIERLLDNWQESIEQRVAKLKEQGLWDYVLGFDFDEPMLHVSNDKFFKVSEYLSKYGKRQRALFSNYEILEGSHPRSEDPEFGMEAHLIDKETCKYLTDIGADEYWCLDYDTRKSVYDEMKRRIGRDDVYIWYVPCTWAFFGNRLGQDHCIKHLDLCYRMLQEEKNPGGLVCYNWVSFKNNGAEGESLDWKFAEENKSRWYRLEEHMIEIGNEIIKKPLNKF